MITKRNIKVPIYKYGLTIIIFDNWYDLEGHIPDYVFETKSLGVVLNNGGTGLVAIRNGAESTIAHESLHLVESIWKFIGYDSIEGNRPLLPRSWSYVADALLGAYAVGILYNGGFEEFPSVG